VVTSEWKAGASFHAQTSRFKRRRLVVVDSSVSLWSSLSPSRGLYGLGFPNHIVAWENGSQTNARFSSEEVGQGDSTLPGSLQCCSSVGDLGRLDVIFPDFQAGIRCTEGSTRHLPICRSCWICATPTRNAAMLWGKALR